MYLKRLDIKNFRVFDEEGVSLIFNQGVNAIIGENNSGKSSVIDAIRIAYSTVTYKKDIFFSKSDFHVNEDGTTADYAQFDVFLEDVPKRLVEIWNPQSESGKGGDFHIKFEKYIAPSGMEKVRSVYWGFGTEGNSLTTDTFEATDVVFLGALRDSENEMKPSKNSKLAQLLRNMVPEEEIRKELVQILTDANNSLLEKDQLIKTKTTINKNLAKIEQEFLNQQIDIGLVEPRFDSIASSLRAWFKPKWLLINKSDSVYEKATEYYQNHKEIKKMQADTRGIYFESSILEDQMDIDAEVSSRIKELANSSFELYQNGLGYNNLLFMSAVLGDMAIEKGKVRLMTIHAAKGLEFPYVFIMQLVEGIFPSRKIRTIEGMEEERRLAFVAVTRSEKGLFLSDSGGRNIGDTSRFPSRFLFDIDPVLLEYTEKPSDAYIQKALDNIDKVNRRFIPSASSLEFKEGDRVRHPVFKDGTVEKIDYDEEAIFILFDSMQTPRAIALRAAKKLEKIQDKIERFS